MSGPKAHLTGAGSCSITASQAGNDNYNAAPDVLRSFSVAKASLTVTAQDRSKTFGDADPSFEVSYVGFVGLDNAGSLGGSLVFNFAGKPPTSYGPSTSVPSDAGSYAIRPSGLSSDDYSFIYKAGTYTISKADQTITFAALADKTYGDADFSVSGSATSGLAVSFSASGDCTVSGSTVHITGAGSCTVTASQAGNNNYNAAPDVPRSFSIAKASLTVTAEDKSKTFGESDPSFTVSYSAFVGSDNAGSLGGPLVFNFAGKPPTSYGPSTTVPTDAGIYAIRPSGLSSDNYSFTYRAGTYTISKADQAISFAALADKIYGDADFDLVATGGGSGNPVTFAPTGKCSVVSGPKAHLTGAGSCSITASQAGNGNYNAAPDVTRSFSIAKASLTVTADDRSKTFGQADAAFTVSYSAFVGSDNAGSLGGSLVFNFAGKPPTSYGPSTAVPSDAGSYAIRPSGLASDDYSFTFKAGTYTIAKADQTITFPVIGGHVYLDPDFDPGATASSSLPVSYSMGAGDPCAIVAGKVHITGAGSCTVTASQAGNNNYNAALDVSQTFAIAKADQTISLPAIGDHVYLQPDFDPGATASSGLAVSYSTGAADQCTIVAGKVHITGAGSCKVTASQGGNANYNAAPDASQTFAIAKADQTITFPVIGGHVYLDPDFDPGATASSSLQVSYSMGAGDPCAIVAGKVHITGAGSCTVTASQAGNNNYNAALDVSRTFTIAKANQTITFGALADKSLGAADFGVSATASSGLTVGFSSLTTAVCTMPTATTVHIAGVGTCTIRASQGGNGNYNAAPNIDRSFPVTWVFHGFFQPVDNVGWNGAQAGSAIPVKFDLNGNQGLNIFASGYPKVTLVTCPSVSTPVDTIEETFAASNSGLQYDSTANPPTGQYIYVWKTEKAWSGTCRRLDVQLVDGQSKSALFQFKK